MSRVIVYSTGTCTFCARAKSLLDKWNIDFTELRIDTDDKLLREFGEATQGASTVPQIIIDGEHIGGFAELTELHMDNGLDHLMMEL